MFNFNRAIYLAAKTKLSIPKDIARYIPFSDELNGVAEYGIDGYASLNNIPHAQIQDKYEKGDTGVLSTDKEYRAIISSYATSELANQFKEEKISLADFHRIMNSIQIFMSGEVSIGETGQFTLDELSTLDSSDETIIPIDTDFVPISDLVGSLMAQSLIAFVGRPKQGKSRIAAAFGLDMMSKGVIDEFWFYENEYTLGQLRQIFRPAIRAYPNLDLSRIRIIRPEEINYKQVLDEVQENPNPKRYIVFDSPDWSVKGNTNETKRLGFMPILNDMLAMRQYNLFIAFTSQANRGAAQGKFTAENVAESDIKVQRVDYAFGLRKQNEENDFGDEQLAYLSVLVQRFGNLRNVENKAHFMFNYHTLQVSPILANLKVDYDEY